MLTHVMIAGIGDLIQNLFDNIIYAFKSLMYGIFLAIAQVCNWIEALFKAFCGLYNLSDDPNTLSNDPASIVITNSTVQTIFISLMVLGIIVLFITTFVAIIKTEFNGFSDKEGNSKKKVFGSVGRALVNMFAIPICCVLGVIMANVLLRALNEALNRGQNSTLATQTFVAMAYNSNRARLENSFVDAYNKDYNSFGVLNESTYPGFEYADMIDAAFLNNLEFKDTGGKKYVVTGTRPETTAQDPVIAVYYPIDYWIDNPEGLQKALDKGKVTSFTIFNSKIVAMYYDFFEVGFLVGIVAIVLVTWNMCMMILGLIKRIFEVGLYYMISPPIIALYPIDGGNGTKSWRTKFLAAVLSAYGGVVAMNIFLILLPVVLQIDFVSVLNFPEFFASMLRYFVNILIVIAGTNFLKATSADIQVMLVGKEGGSGALADGTAASKAVGSTIGKTAKLTAAGVGLGASVAGAGARLVGSGLAAAGGGLSKAVGAGLNKAGLTGAGAFFSNAGSKGLNAAKSGMSARAWGNWADRAVGRGATMLGQIGSAITGSKYDKSKKSKTMFRDSVNFFRTGTADKERQQAIMRARNEYKEAEDKKRAFTSSGEEAELQGLETQRQEQRQREIDIANQKAKIAGMTGKGKRAKAALRAEQVKLANMEADFAREKASIQANAARFKELSEKKAAFEATLQTKTEVENMSGVKGFLRLRALDRATASGKNIENVRSDKEGHDIEELIHTTQVHSRMRGYKK